MIFQAIFDVIFSALKFLFSLIPSMSVLSIPGDIVTLLTDLIKKVGYFLPLGDFALMFGAFLIVMNFRFIFNLLNRLWDMLPLT